MKLSGVQKRVLADLGNGGTLASDEYRYFFEQSRAATVSGITVKKLESSGLIEHDPQRRSQYRLTSDGVKFLRDAGISPVTAWPHFKPTQCQYCGKDPERISGCFNAPSVRYENCVCGFEHKACKECWKRLQKILGEFPAQRLRLKECPKR